MNSTPLRTLVNTVKRNKAWNKTVFFLSLHCFSIKTNEENILFLTAKLWRINAKSHFLNPLRQSRVSGSDCELKAKRGNNNMLFAAC